MLTIIKKNIPFFIGLSIFLIVGLVLLLTTEKGDAVLFFHIASPARQGGARFRGIEPEPIDELSRLCACLKAHPGAETSHCESEDGKDHQHAQQPHH